MPTKPPAPPLARVRSDRDTAIAAAYASGGYTLPEVGAFFERHDAQVSRIARRIRDAKRKTPLHFASSPKARLLMCRQ
jgi:putative transposase